MSMEKSESPRECGAGISSDDGGACLVFALDEQRYAIPLRAVERIIRAVEITQLPKAPEAVLGIINDKGRIVPVADLRSRFRLPARELRCDDRFILLRTPRRPLAVIADSVGEIRFFPPDSKDSAKGALPHMEYLQGVAVLDDGLVLIYDLDRFLSLDEETALDAALTGGG